MQPNTRAFTHVENVQVSETKFKSTVKKTKVREEPIDLLRLSGTTKRPWLIFQEYDEKNKLDDVTQLKMVPYKLEVDILCERIRKDANLSSFRKLHFEKLSRDDKMKIEEAMYQMM